MARIVALLPAGKLFDRVFAESLAPAAEQTGYDMVRLSSEFSTQNELGKLCAEIEKADLAIADLTGRNPNIMYQVGYSHGAGKKVLLIAQHGENFAFDKTRHTTILYAGDLSFLKSEVIAFLTGTPQSPVPAENARAKFETTFGDILKAHGHVHHGEIQLENPTTFVLIGQDMDLALVQDLARRARELGLRIKLM